MTKAYWYVVTFSKGSSQRSYMVSAACVGNAKAAGWCRLEETEGTREGWSMASYSPAEPQPKTEIDASLILDASDESELFYAFKSRGESSTRRHVAKFLLDLDRNKGIKTPECHWYAAYATPQATPTIVSIHRDTVCGSCSLYADYTDGSLHRLLFSFYIDELHFSDAELVGKTEKEAHDLRLAKDVAYLKS